MGQAARLNRLCKVRLLDPGPVFNQFLSSGNQFIERVEKQKSGFLYFNPVNICAKGLTIFLSLRFQGCEVGCPRFQGLELALDANQKPLYRFVYNIAQVHACPIQTKGIFCLRGAFSYWSVADCNLIYQGWKFKVLYFYQDSVAALTGLRNIFLGAGSLCVRLELLLFAHVRIYQALAFLQLQSLAGRGAMNFLRPVILSGVPCLPAFSVGDRLSPPLGRPLA